MTFVFIYISCEDDVTWLKQIQAGCNSFFLIKFFYLRDNLVSLQQWHIQINEEYADWLQHSLNLLSLADFIDVKVYLLNHQNTVAAKFASIEYLKRLQVVFKYLKVDSLIVCYNNAVDVEPVVQLWPHPSHHVNNKRFI